jgi:hypothetical protein
MPLENKLTAWYVGPRLPDGTTGIAPDLPTELDAIHHATNVGKGAYAEVHTFRDQNHGDIVVKRVLKLVKCDSRRNKLSFGMPQDALVPYLIRGMRLPHILDIMTHPVVSFHIYAERTVDTRVVPATHKERVWSTTIDTIMNSMDNDNGTVTIDLEPEDSIFNQLRRFDPRGKKNSKDQESENIYVAFSIIMDNLPFSYRAIRKMQGAPLFELQALHILARVCTQLIEMYDATAMVYTDAKMDNVMFSRKTLVFLVDFGSFYRIGEHCAQTYKIPVNIYGVECPMLGESRASALFGAWSLFVLFNKMTNRNDFHDATCSARLRAWKLHLGSHWDAIVGGNARIGYVERMRTYMESVLHMTPEGELLPVPNHQLIVHEPTLIEENIEEDEEVDDVEQEEEEEIELPAEISRQIMRSIESGGEEESQYIVSMEQLQEMVENVYLPENQSGAVYGPEHSNLEIRLTAEAASWFQDHQMSQGDQRGQKRQMSRQTIDESERTGTNRNTPMSEMNAATPNDLVMRNRSTENRNTPMSDVNAATPIDPVMQIDPPSNNKRTFNSKDFDDILNQAEMDYENHLRLEMLREEKAKNEALLRALHEQLQQDEYEEFALERNAGSTIPIPAAVVQSPTRSMRQNTIDSEEDRPLAQVYGNPRRAQNIAVETLNNAEIPLDLGDDFAPQEVQVDVGMDVPVPAKRAARQTKKKKALVEVDLGSGPVPLRTRIRMIRDGTPYFSNVTKGIVKEWELFRKAEETVLPEERKSIVGKNAIHKAEDELILLRRNMKALYMGLMGEYQSPDFDETRSGEAVEEQKLENLYNKIGDFLTHYYSSQRVADRAKGKVRKTSKGKVPNTVKVKPIDPELFENEPIDPDLIENDLEEPEAYA